MSDTQANVSVLSAQGSLRTPSASRWLEAGTPMPATAATASASPRRFERADMFSSVAEWRCTSAPVTPTEDIERWMYGLGAGLRTPEQGGPEGPPLHGA